MKHLILTVGKPGLAYARAGAEEYFSRLRHYGNFEWKQIKKGRRAEEGERLLAASAGFFRVLLDEHGALVDTRGLLGKFEQWELSGRGGGVAFLIGGADGHAEAVRGAADWVWSLSPLTLQHELALVLLLEQIYRVQSLRRGEPYHRD